MRERAAYEIVYESRRAASSWVPMSVAYGDGNDSSSSVKSLSILSNMVKSDL